MDMLVRSRAALRGSAGLGPLVSLALLACDMAVPRATTLPADTSATVHTGPMPARLPKTKGKVPTVQESAAFANVRAWLRRLVVAEETYFAETGTYTAALKSAQLEPPPDVTMTILWATRDGWAARAQRNDMPGRDCVIYVGSSRPAPATAKYGRQAREGVPICDAPSDAAPVAVATSRRARRTPAVDPSADPVADTVSGLDLASPIVQMKVDLRNLVRSQELWLASQGAYARRAELLSIQYLWHRGVKVRITSASRDAWSATATHDALPGKSCVVWVGPVATAPRTIGQGRQTDRAAVPVCDDPS